tara:strand:- start:66 stop:515 length:450 start_codon:yes stop_codon:yes gene_type:complete
MELESRENIIQESEDILYESNILENIITPQRRRYYTSNIPDTYIRDAITGDLYPYKVGSYESLRLFKYIDATGTCDSEGRQYSKKDRNLSRDANSCYYTCPEECMKHRKIKFSEKRVKDWYTFQESVFINNEFSLINFNKLKLNKKSKD